MMKKSISAAAILVLSACSTGKNHGPTYSYNELQVVNNSQQQIRDMTISVPDTDSVYDCGNIAALGICSKRFGRQRYTQAPFSVAWTFGSGERQTDEIAIKIPAYSSPGIPLLAMLEISAEGVISAYFEQLTPD
jgi:hypothetical protein